MVVGAASILSQTVALSVYNGALFTHSYCPYSPPLVAGIAACVFAMFICSMLVFHCLLATANFIYICYAWHVHWDNLLLDMFEKRIHSKKKAFCCLLIPLQYSTVWCSTMLWNAIQISIRFKTTCLARSECPAPDGAVPLILSFTLIAQAKANFTGCKHESTATIGCEVAVVTYLFASLFSNAFRLATNRRWHLV